VVKNDVERRYGEHLPLIAIAGVSRADKRKTGHEQKQILPILRNEDSARP
jgi:hypothetical protein